MARTKTTIKEKMTDLYAANAPKKEGTFGEICIKWVGVIVGLVGILSAWGYISKEFGRTEERISHLEHQINEIKTNLDKQNEKINLIDKKVYHLENKKN